MVFKILFVGVLVYYLFRQFKVPQIKKEDPKTSIKKDYDDYVDYEEVE